MRFYLEADRDRSVIKSIISCSTAYIIQLILINLLGLSDYRKKASEK